MMKKLVVWDLNALPFPSLVDGFDRFDHWNLTMDRRGWVWAVRKQQRCIGQMVLR